MLCTSGTNLIVLEVQCGERLYAIVRVEILKGFH